MNDSTQTAILDVIPENIPDGPKQRVHWVPWRLEIRNKKPTKVPYVAGTSRRASSTDPTTWSSFSHALASYERGEADGIGYVLTEDDGYVVIDLDHMVSGGELSPTAHNIVGQFNSYTELSPSGTGVHIWIKGALPEGVGGRRKGPIEVYQSGRFITVTGHTLGDQR